MKVGIHAFTWDSNLLKELFENHYTNEEDQLQCSSKAAIKFCAII